MKKNYLFLFISLITAAHVYSQKLHVNKINYPFGNVTGTENYQYITKDTYKDIPNGAYSLHLAESSNVNNIHGSAILTIVGTFENALPSGEWSYNYTFTNYGSDYLNGSIILKQHWNSGKASGLFIYKKNLKKRNCNYNAQLRKYVLLNSFNSDLDNGYISFSFIDGQLNGKCIYKNNEFSPKIDAYNVFKNGQLLELVNNVGIKQHFIAGNNGICTSGFSLDPYDQDYKLVYSEEELGQINRLNAKAILEDSDKENVSFVIYANIPKEIIGSEFWSKIRDYSPQTISPLECLREYSESSTKFETNAKPIGIYKYNECKKKAL